jgi:hypothetical protein
VKKPRWFEPRLEGVVVREHVPRDFLDVVGDHAAAYGYEVGGARAEERSRGPSAYRTSEPDSSLHLVATRPRFRLVSDEVHLWRADDRALHYEMTFRSLTRSVTWLHVAGLVLGAALLLAPTRPEWEWLEVMAANAIVYANLTYLIQRRRLRIGLVRMLDLELARVSLSVGQSAPRAARISSEGATTHVDSDAPAAPAPLRIASREPALAATVRTARDAFVRHHERSPEDEVKALEETARRRGE